MNPNRLVVLLLLAAVTATSVVLSWRAATEKTRAQSTVVKLENAQEGTAARIAALEKQIATNTKSAEAIEADNSALTEALGRAKAAGRSQGVPVPTGRGQVEARLRQARLVSLNGDPDEALSELLWSWEEGIKHLTAGDAAAQRSFIMSSLAELAKRHPPAMAALRERRDILRRRVLTGPVGQDAVLDYAGVLRALDEEEAIVSLFDYIPKGDRRRGTIAIYGAAQLVEMRRYDLALEGFNPSQMISSFEEQSKTSQLRAPRQDHGHPAVRGALQSIEILAGGGNLAHARELAERVMGFDPSPETRILIQHHTERAGQPNLLSNRSP